MEVIWTPCLDRDPLALRLRTELIEIVWPEGIVPSVPIDYVEFGINSGYASARDYEMMIPRKLLRSGFAGKLRLWGSRSPKEPIFQYTAVLFRDRSTVELVEWKHAEGIVNFYVQGEFIGSIEKLVIPYVGKTWWARLWEAMTRSHYFKVKLREDVVGTIVTPAVSPSATELLVDEVALPIHLSRKARGPEREGYIDYRDPELLSGGDFVIPAGTPPINARLRLLLFCTNIAFRLHFFTSDFGDA